MSTKLKKIVMIAAISTTAAAGSTVTGPVVASAAPTSSVSATPAQQPAELMNVTTLAMRENSTSPPLLRAPLKAAPTWVNKTWAFVQCIVGVGVPIGLAWSIVANPALLAWLAGRGPLPGTAGGFGVNYLTWLKRACGYVFTY